MVKACESCYIVINSAICKTKAISTATLHHRLAHKNTRHTDCTSTNATRNEACMLHTTTTKDTQTAQHNKRTIHTCCTLTTAPAHKLHTNKYNSNADAVPPCACYMLHARNTHPCPHRESTLQQQQQQHGTGAHAMHITTKNTRHQGEHQSVQSTTKQSCKPKIALAYRLHTTTSDPFPSACQQCAPAP